MGGNFPGRGEVFQGESDGWEFFGREYRPGVNFPGTFFFI